MLSQNHLKIWNIIFLKFFVTQSGVFSGFSQTFNKSEMLKKKKLFNYDGQEIYTPNFLVQPPSSNVTQF